MAGMGLGRYAHADACHGRAGLYDMPRFGKVSFLHMTDCHAQLKPIYFREPSVNLGFGGMAGQSRTWWASTCSRWACGPARRWRMRYTYLDFETAARRYGKVGGFAHLATLVKRMKASRPGALLLDGGDTWQGSATALWTNAQDMVDACKLLGVDVMTGHWEFTYGMERVKEIVEKDFKGKVDFVAQNVKTNDFGDPVFKPYVLREINGVKCAIIGQAFPYTPIANPRYMVADWAFGIQDDNMQKHGRRGPRQGRQGGGGAVAQRHGCRPEDGQPRHEASTPSWAATRTTACPWPAVVKNKWPDLVTNAGSNSKFLGVLDFEVKDGKVADFRYKLLPVFSNMLPPDRDMDALITKGPRALTRPRLTEKLAVTEGLLYRRGNFNGTWRPAAARCADGRAGAEIAFSPGLPLGHHAAARPDVITRELADGHDRHHLPYTTVTEMTGEMIKTVLEDVATTCSTPTRTTSRAATWCAWRPELQPATRWRAWAGASSDMRLNGKPIEADKTYKVAGWAPVAEEAATAPGSRMVWDLVEQWLKGARPLDLDASVLCQAIPQVQIDQALVRNSGLAGHRLEILHHVLRQAHRHRLLQLGRIRVAAGLHPGKVVLCFHISHLDKTRPPSGWPSLPR
jgi:sulfur-oxidizing protein SoxB